MLEPMPRATEAVFDWMDAKRRQLVRGRIEAQLAKARRRGSRRALVVLEDLDVMLEQLR